MKTYAVVASGRRSGLIDVYAKKVDNRDPQAFARTTEWHELAFYFCDAEADLSQFDLSWGGGPARSNMSANYIVDGHLLDEASVRRLGLKHEIENRLLGRLVNIGEGGLIAVTRMSPLIHLDAKRGDQVVRSDA